MSESINNNKILNPNLSDLSDDEDLFVSTYEQPFKQPLKNNKEVSLAEEVEKVENEKEELTPKESVKVENASSSEVISADIVGNENDLSLESKMDTINLNDDYDDDSAMKKQDSAKPEETSNQLDEKISNTTAILDSNESTSICTNLPTLTPITEAVMEQQSNKLENQSKSNTTSQISIMVSDPQKIGEGMASYMVYSVTTRTTLPYFRRQSMSVNRRFSDFLGLHSKLLMKHAHSGRIIPPPPAKSAVGTAKVKMAKDDTLQSMDFLAKRRAALERYLQRTAQHPILCSDPDFREFLELEADLPRSTSTSALSGAGVKRLFSLVGDTVQKMTFRMEESDPWFESKQQQIEVLDSQLKKLQVATDSLIYHRKELSGSLGLLGKSTAIMGYAELKNVSLSCALSHLAATHEKVEKIYEKQANNDFLYLSELLRDYIGMIGAVKEAFHERVKSFQHLTSLEQTLHRKRETKTRMDISLKPERPTQLDDEIADLEDKAKKAKENFEQISETIKDEFERFDTNRIRDFKNNFLKYIESLLETQESLIECWEKFLPEAKSISA